MNSLYTIDPKLRVPGKERHVLTLGTPSSTTGKSSSIVSDEREVARENSTGVPSSTKALGASLNTPVLDLGPES